MATERGPEVSGSDFRAKTLRVSDELEFKGLRAKSNTCVKVGTPGYECQVELELLNSKDAKELGLPEGTRFALHKCVTPKSREGVYIPIEAPTDAAAVSAEHCGCVQTQSKSAREKCARK